MMYLKFPVLMQTELLVAIFIKNASSGSEDYLRFTYNWIVDSWEVILMTNTLMIFAAVMIDL
jgi:hypothetical protein